jgi:hypothetical protein
MWMHGVWLGQREREDTGDGHNDLTWGQMEHGRAGWAMDVPSRSFIDAGDVVVCTPVKL